MVKVALNGIVIFPSSIVVVTTTSVCGGKDVGILGSSTSLLPQVIKYMTICSSSSSLLPEVIKNMTLCMKK